jgi:F-type H+-transporting ATPase subunit gamma
MKAIKGRIKSVKSTQQITKAMNLVATSKLARAREKLKKERPYSDQMRLLLTRIATDIDLSMHPCFAAKSGEKTLVVLITGDRGLCGGYNTNASRSCTDILKDSKNVEFLCVGSKGRDYYIRRGRTVVKTITGITESPFVSDAEEISEMVTSAYDSGEYGAIYLAYTKFHTVVSYEPVAMRLLPVDTAALPAVSGSVGAEVMSFEPADASLVEYAVRCYVEALIFNALSESAAAQLASKMVSMETATDNADKMINTLTLTYNRARQAKITQELTEIVAGANALK